MKKILLLSSFWLSSLQAGICGSKSFEPKDNKRGMYYWSHGRRFEVGLNDKFDRNKTYVDINKMPLPNWKLADGFHLPEEIIKLERGYKP